MRTTTGVFKTFVEAERACADLRSLGIPSDDINIVAPGLPVESLEAIPTTDAEQRGIGKALGGLVGGVAGAALGPLGTAAISYMVPGVGPVSVIGFLASAIVAAVGRAVTGTIAGGALEDSLSQGLPRDELFVYKDALRQGRAILIVLTTENEQAEEARRILSRAGAETVDAAREQWWIGLRGAEKERYAAM